MTPVPPHRFFRGRGAPRRRWMARVERAGRLRRGQLVEEARQPRCRPTRAMREVHADPVRFAFLPDGDLDLAQLCRGVGAHRVARGRAAMVGDGVRDLMPQQHRELGIVEVETPHQSAADHEFAAGHAECAPRGVARHVDFPVPRGSVRANLRGGDDQARGDRAHTTQERHVVVELALRGEARENLPVLRRGFTAECIRIDGGRLGQRRATAEGKQEKRSPVHFISRRRVRRFYNVPVSDTSLHDFIALLEKGPAGDPCVFNPWRDSDERDRAPRRDMPRLRRENMEAYLDARRNHARVMLLGEAPSHRGCRFTGIAFCSETELTQKAGLVARRALALTSREAEVKPQRERSAAVIWGEIERAGKPFEIVLWNAFPWHPYLTDDPARPGPCGPSSNRRPKLDEVAQGRRAFDALLSCFAGPLDVFAVGKVAQNALARWEETRCAGYLRHPAQGGEALFRSQFRRDVVPRL